MLWKWIALPGAVSLFARLILRRWNHRRMSDEITLDPRRVRPKRAAMTAYIRGRQSRAPVRARWPVLLEELNFGFG
jgi:hypothetical protein